MVYISNVILSIQRKNNKKRFGAKHKTPLYNLLTATRTELTSSERLKVKTGKTITMPRYSLE